MPRKIKTKNRKTNKTRNIRKTIKNKKGGTQYKHRRVGLYFTDPSNKNTHQINCEICRNNDYIERFSTIGKTKGNQAVVNFFVGDTILEDLNNISIITHVCRICSMCKIVRDDKKNYIFPKVL